MATKTFYVTRDMKHPLYRTRMLRAGDELELDGPAASLYRRLGVITDEKPRPVPAARSKPAELPSTQIREGKPGGSKPGSTAKRTTTTKRKTTTRKKAAAKK